MRIQKSIRKRRTSREDSALEMTSLMDVITILLFFLLTGYNTSSLVIDVPKDIKLPMGQSKENSDTGVIISISKTKIIVNNKEVVNFDDPALNMSRVFDQGGRRIAPLYDELITIKEDNELVAQSSPQAKPFSGVINLVADKEIKYEIIKKIMHTCAEAGYAKYKFIVLAEDGQG